MWPKAPIRQWRSVLVVLFLVHYLGSAQAQSLSTYASRIIGLKGDESPRAMEVDPQGNAYVVGNFRATSITIDTSTLRNVGPPNMLAGTSSDCFLAKFRPSGTLEWAFAFGGDKDELVVDIALAPNGTGIFLVGNFQSEVMVFSSGAGPPVENVIYGATNQIEYNTFLIRVTPAGKVMWVSQTGDGDVAGMVVDAVNERIYLTGAYPGDPVAVDNGGGGGSEALPNFGSKWSAGLEDDDTDDGTGSGALVKFNGNGGSDGGVAGAATGGGAGGSFFGKSSADIYVDHYSMKTGDLIAGIAFEGEKNDFATGMTLLPKASAMFIAGYFQSSRFTLSPVLTLSNEKDASSSGVGRALPAGFVVRMDSKFGTVMWGKNLGGVEASPPLQVAVDEASKSVYVTGSFSSPGVLALSDGKSAGLLRLSQQTGGILWARPMPRPASVAMDVLGFIFVAGTYTAPVTLGPGVGLAAAGSSGGDVYLARVAAEDGATVLTRSFRGEPQGKYGVSALDVDGGGNVYLAGNFTQGSMHVGGQMFLTPGTNVDGFVGRVLMASGMSVTMTPGTVLLPQVPAAASTSSSSSSSTATTMTTTESNTGLFGGLRDRDRKKKDTDASETIGITSLNEGGSAPAPPAAAAATTTRAPTRAPTARATGRPPVAPLPAAILSDSTPSEAAATPRPAIAPENRPTRAPTARPTLMPRFKLTWAPTAGLPAKGAVATAAAAVAPPETAKAAAAPAATAPPATTSSNATPDTPAVAVPAAPSVPAKRMDITFIYAGPASDVSALQVALYQVLKPHITSYLSLPAVKLGKGRRRRVLHGRQLAPGEECTDPNTSKIRLRFQVDCASEPSAVMVVKLLDDIFAGNIKLKSGMRTFATSLICSLTAAETVVVPVPTPPPAVKEAPPPPITTASDSSSSSAAFLEAEGTNGGDKTKISTVGVDLAIAFGVLAALALVAGWGYRKSKKGRETRAAEEMRDAEWERTRRLEQVREEESRLTGATFVSDVNASSNETLPASIPYPPTYSAVSLEQQEEGEVEVAVEL